MPIGEERDSALDSSVAFRDDTEALRARIESLESELGEAKKTIARMKGAGELVDLAKFEALPKRPFGWKRRVRRFQGTLLEDAYEHLARVVPTLTQLTPSSARAGGVFTMSSQAERIMVMATEENEVVFVFDEYDAKVRQVVTPAALALLPSAVMSSPNRDLHEYWAILVAIAVIVCFALYGLFVAQDKKRFAEGDKLFEAVGAHIERALTGAPGRHEAEEAEDEELEAESHSGPKTMDA